MTTRRTRRRLALRYGAHHSRPRARGTSDRRLRARGATLAAVLQALVLLRSGRHTVDELAAEIGQHRRTAYRLLTVIERAGIVLQRSREWPHTYYTADADSIRRLLCL